MKKVLVIGGNAAGISAASQVKRQHPDWPVAVFEQGRYISYGACGIPYYVQGLVPDLSDLITVTPDEAVNKRKLDLKLNHRVTAIDPAAKIITVQAPDGPAEVSFDRLVIATGARPQSGGIDFKSSGRIFTVNNLSDADALSKFMAGAKPKKGVVIGGGYIAIEMVEALKNRGLETHLIHRRESLARTFEKEISDLALSEMDRQNIILHLNRPVSRVGERDGQVEVETARETLSYDLAIVATGVEPNSDLATSCGIETGVRGAIKVDKQMRTSHADIFAAGDCVETTDLITGRPVYVALALKANKEGVTAGINAAGGNEIFPGVLGTAVTKVFNLGLARTGMTLAEAEKNGFNAVKYSLTARSRAHYYPGGGFLTAVLIAEKETGRLLGAQLAGPVDSVKRIDVYATAITAEMTVNRIFQLDLAYAPPFSPVYDPVILTGRVGRKLISK